MPFVSSTQGRPVNERSPDIVFGIHPVEELLANRANHIHRVYFADKTNSRTYEIIKHCRKERIPYQLVPASRLFELAGPAKHQGIVVLCSAKPYSDTEALFSDLDRAAKPPLLLVAASVEDPRNLGAIIRSAVAFGVSGLLVERKHSAHLNAATAKASAGMIERIAIARPRSLEATLRERRDKGYQVVGAVAGAPKRPHEIDFLKPTILVLGGEHRGIPPYLHSLCTDFVGIPIASEVQSLNVSVAASIVLYECSRQRAASADRSKSTI